MSARDGICSKGFAPSSSNDSPVSPRRDHAVRWRLPHAAKALPEALMDHGSADPLGRQQLARPRRSAPRARLVKSRRKEADTAASVNESLPELAVTAPLIQHFHFAYRQLGGGKYLKIPYQSCRDFRRDK